MMPFPSPAPPRSMTIDDGTVVREGWLEIAAAIANGLARVRKPAARMRVFTRFISGSLERRHTVDTAGLAAMRHRRLTLAVSQKSGLGCRV